VVGPGPVLGVEYRIVGSELTFDTPGIVPGLNLPSRDFRTAGLGLSLIFDSRNSTFTPDRGIYLKAQLSRQDDLFGGRFAQEDSPFGTFPV
jgi:hypothetical protein